MRVSSSYTPFMINLQTTSWLFLVLALSSQKEPASLKGISQIADAINHSVPTQKEMESSLSWLLKQGLIITVAKKYSLTERGNKIFIATQNETNVLLKMWRSIEDKFNELKSEV